METLARERNLFLSNVDQVLNFDVQMVRFFRQNKDYPPAIVAEMVKKGVGESNGRLRVFARETSPEP
ncbi:hypothetical protein IGI04_041592 [Brassica rapa subsp. trilocularis]|uniref:Uncharacterized protein n=1 Tax=Brassica rapa subsp. trilocularis TaxID=1813537 RepID=A0ABQ7KSE3_BRACM|nr:hypothetical protein IGI04_041592 [Brassica rapa subsp. trilocularis]